MQDNDYRCCDAKRMGHQAGRFEKEERKEGKYNKHSKKTDKSISLNVIIPPLKHQEHTCNCRARFVVFYDCFFHEPSDMKDRFLKEQD